MKRLILTISIGLLGLMTVFAQKPMMSLTFTANYNGQYVPLTSILIKNMSSGEDTILYAPDTVLKLNYVLGLDENNNPRSNCFTLKQNYPNPMDGKTIVSLWTPIKNDILITISDAVGRELINQRFKLEAGSHTFCFYPEKQGLYFLTAQAEEQSQTIKMYNRLPTRSGMELCKLQYNGKTTGSGEFKAMEDLNGFVFNQGDQLQYTASSTQGSRQIIDSPTMNQTYSFQFGSGGIKCPGMPTVTDIDGNVYNTVLIGTQCWMKENLKTTTYRNGTVIPFVWEHNVWPNLTTGAYCWYPYFPTWKDTYGALYNWFATVDSNGLCPTGWHVPTNDEWTSLADYIDPTHLLAGCKLRSCRQVNSPLSGDCNTNEHPRWEEDVTSTHTYGTDDYGFAGLPGGWRLSCGDCISMGYTGFWWTSDGLVRLIYYYDSMFHLSSSFNNACGISVRCLRD
jgi:uncharacterized protein (TIGR02145 family)